MHLKRLKLDNFRRFRDFKIDFHEQLTVIVARNGLGKTSVLDAITVALGTFIGAFDLGKANHLERSDATYLRIPNSSDREQQYPITVYAEFDDPSMKVCRQLTGPKNKTTIKDAIEITSYGKKLQQSVRDMSLEALPVVAYYGTGRLWKAHKNKERKRVLSESRTMGYEDCLSSISNFTQLQQWMTKASHAFLQQLIAEATLEGFHNPYPDPIHIGTKIEVIQEAVNQMLSEEGWSKFEYYIEYEELAMFHNEHGILPISLLSDGVRAMVSLVADLAFRCVKLNGFLGDEVLNKTKGIVLIDEVDLHLHPAWQQTVLPNLLKVFPSIQFIVTTHSPQVLSTIHRENIRLIGKTEDILSATLPLRITYGEPSDNVMHSVMEVDPQPPIKEKVDLQELTELVDQGAYASQKAQDLRRELIAILGETHPQLQRIARSIQRQEFLKR
ncbi:MAG: AAA family ATPase [Thiotrichaceae bacterium]|nr:AAA family ATPase [Thiotrichaceae bacterium]